MFAWISYICMAGLVWLIEAQETPVVQVPGERHLANLRQLTFGGENAEGYFSFNEKMVTFQSTHPPYQCDQQFTLDLATGTTRLVSTGRGRTTCGYFMPGDTTLLFASTHEHLETCPPLNLVDK